MFQFMLEDEPVAELGEKRGLGGAGSPSLASDQGANVPRIHGEESSSNSEGPAARI